MSSYEVEAPINPPTPFMNEFEELLATHPELFTPIPTHLDADGHYPNGSVDDWRGKNDPNHRIDIEDNGEPLVVLSSLNPPIFVSSGYTDKLDSNPYEDPLSTVLSQYLRAGAAERLSNAQKLLPRAYRFIVFDAWRDLETQMRAYNFCFESIVDNLIEADILQSRDISPEISEIISQETQKYISLPSPMPDSTNPSPEDIEEGMKIPSPHNTGGSVDVAIVRIDDDALENLEHLEQLLSDETDPIKRAELNFEVAAIYRMHATKPDFGTDFDFAGQEASLTYHENEEVDTEPKLLRRMLYNVMTAVGFEAYNEEWWHFNFGNQMAERTKMLRTNKKGVAIYGNTQLTGEQKALERVHEIVFDDLVRAHNDPENYTIHPVLARLSVTTQQLLEASKQVGDPRETRDLGAPHTLKHREITDEFAGRIKEQLNLNA